MQRLLPAVAAVAFAIPALADTETVSLTYDAPAECPARAAFETEVHARTARVAFGEDGRRFDVRLARVAGRYVGTLAITETDGRRNERTLDGDACEDVVSGIALVAALAIDPEASTAKRETLLLQPPAETPEPAPEPAAQRRPSPSPRRTEPPPSTRLEPALGLDVVGEVGPAPIVLVAAGPELEVVRRSRLDDVALRIGALGAQTGVTGPADDQARYRWFVARIELCPLGSEAALRLRACLLTDVGLLRAEGRGVAVPEARNRPWAGIGLGGIVGRMLTARLYFDLHLNAVLNLTRDRFLFQAPTVPVYDVPPASAGVGLSAGVKIP